MCRAQLFAAALCFLPHRTQGFVAAPSRCVSSRSRASCLNAAATSAASEWALIFDCDGVILESESLHREAYNAVFREFSVAYEWTPDYYDLLQNLVGGGKPKMRYYFDMNGWPASSVGPAPQGKEEKENLLDVLQDRKTDIYKDFVRGGTAELRPGIARLIEEAFAMSPRPKMAICSASTKSACLFVLENLLGKELISHFDLVLAGDDVPRRKPDPLIYTLACEKLSLPPEKCIVIEDSLIGLQAASGANIPCIITYTPSTESQDFAGAVAVYPDLEGGGGGSPVTAAGLRNMVAARTATAGAR